MMMATILFEWRWLIFPQASLLAKEKDGGEKWLEMKNKTIAVNKLRTSVYVAVESFSLFFWVQVAVCVLFGLFLFVVVYSSLTIALLYGCRNRNNTVWVLWTVYVLLDERVCHEIMGFVGYRYAVLITFILR